LDRAREIIGVGPDSVLNAEVAIAVHAVNREKRTAVTCYAEAQDTELFRAVVGQEVAAGEVNRLESFNRHDRTARVLLDAYPPAPAADTGPVLVIGYAGLGRVLVGRLVRAWSAGMLPGGAAPCVWVVRLTDSDVERLARAEHRRWMDERAAKGWRHGPVRDDDRKLHPDLVDWEYLTDDGRDKDRAAVRAIPEHLDAAGLQAVRTR
jgi:hypothetical protein